MAKGDDQIKNEGLPSACKNGFLQPCQISLRHGDIGKVSLRNYLMNTASPAGEFNIIELLSVWRSD